MVRATWGRCPGSGYLQDGPGAGVQEPQPAVLGGEGQAAAVGTEAGAEQQHLSRPGLTQGADHHAHRTPEDRPALGHVPQTHLGGGGYVTFLPPLLRDFDVVHFYSIFIFTFLIDLA